MQERPRIAVWLRRTAARIPLSPRSWSTHLSAKRHGRKDILILLRVVCVSGGESLDATGRFGQAGYFARLLRRPIGEQFVQVLAVAFLRSELLAYRLGKHPHRRSDLELVVVFAQKIDDFPVVGRQLEALQFGDAVCNV